MAHKDLKRAGLKATAPRLLILQLFIFTHFTFFFIFISSINSHGADVENFAIVSNTFSSLLSISFNLSKIYPPKRF